MADVYFMVGVGALGFGVINYVFWQRGSFVPNGIACILVTVYAAYNFYMAYKSLREKI